MLSYSDAVRGGLPNSFFATYGNDDMFTQAAYEQLKRYLNGSVDTSVMYIRHYTYKHYRRPYAVANSIENAIDDL